MNDLYEAKETVKGWLVAEGIDARINPSNVGPDVVVIEAGSPYVEAGETFTEQTVRYEVVCIGPSVDREDAEENLDQLISNVIVALKENNCLIEVVSQPGDLPYGTAIYLAATVTVSASITFTKEVVE